MDGEVERRPPESEKIHVHQRAQMHCSVPDGAGFLGLQLQPAGLETSKTQIQFNPHPEAHLTLNQDRKRMKFWNKLHQKPPEVR